jgi:ankyrin repeat protein
LGKWSVAFALVPLCVVLLFLLPIFLGDYSGEAGLGALLAIGMIIFFGVHTIVLTSLVGAILGALAISKTQWKKGKVGLALNVLLLIASGASLTINYYRMYNDPDRLNLAIRRGEIRKVKRLLKRGFDVNNVFHGGRTALHDALGNKDMVELLLAYGADANIRGGGGLTPLHLVCGPRPILGSNSKWDGPEVFELLVKHGADIEARTTKGVGTWGGWVPLHCAADAGNVVMIEKLLAHGADINAETNDGHTALSLAANRGYLEAAKLLIQHGAGVNRPGTKKRYPLLAAAKEGKKAMVEFILETGANPNLVDSDDQAAIHYALYCRDDKAAIEIIYLLLDAGADVNKQSRGGETPLHRAAIYHRPEQALCLLNHGAKVNAGTLQDQTPLHRAVSYSQERWGRGESQKRVIEIMLAKGALVDIKDSRGRTPLDYVKRWKIRNKEEQQFRSEIIQLLQKYETKNNSKNSPGYRNNIVSYKNEFGECNADIIIAALGL